MKNKTKTLIAGLAVMPLVFAFGCGGGSAKIETFGKDTFDFGDRTYSSETEVDKNVAFGTEIAQPTTENGKVVATKLGNDGSRVITMEGVEESEYTTYKSQVETTTVATGTGNIVVEYDAETKTMTITYTLPEGSEVTGPSSFRMVNLVDNSKDGIYVKYAIDMSKMIPETTREEAYEEWKEQNAGVKDDDNTLKEAYYQKMLASRPKGNMAIEYASRKGSTEGTYDVATALYLKNSNFLDMSGDEGSSMFPAGSLVSLSYKSVYSGSEVIEFMHMDAVGPIPETNVYNKAEMGGETLLPFEVNTSNFGIIGNSYDELIGMYASTGYETVNNNVYYYEEFSITEEGESAPTYLKFYFNGNNLIYADLEGMLVELYVSNDVPAHMFETRIPDGYLDMSSMADV